MAIGIYKPGQGYWVRVLTASMLGVIVLATSAWVWKETQIIVEKLPRSVWTIALSTPKGPAPAPSARVTLLGAPAAGAPEDTPGEPIGSATVTEFEPANNVLRLRAVDMTKPGADPTQTRAVQDGPADKPTFTAAVPTTPFSAPAVEPLYIQGGAVAAVMVIGAILIYWLVAVKPTTADFLIATDTEMKKVNWSNLRDIRTQTAVVIGATFLLATVLFLFDLAFQAVFRSIGILSS